jgi:DNA repair protein RadC
VSVTERLRQAGALLGLKVLDHVILGHDGHFSFLDAGLMS